MPSKPPEPERSKEEVERLAGELARKVMSMPHKKLEWPGKRKAGRKMVAKSRK
jgi:hypothetical protein